jgi:hypothetical protein
MKIEKIGGTFTNVGDVVTLTKPAGAAQVALRLYEKTLEIALFVVTDAQGVVAQSDPQVTPELPRHFAAHLTTDDLPATFVKYVGALGLPNSDGTFTEVYVIETSE